MPPDILGGVRVVIRWLQHTQQRVVVLHGTKATDWTSAQLLTLATAVRDVFITNNARDQVADDLVLQDVVATSLNGSASEQRTVPCVANCNGTQTGAPAPGNITSTISWRTTGIGRSKRGRSYMPGYLDSQTNDDDTITSLKISQLGLLASDLFLAFSSSGGSLGVYSRVLGVITAVATWITENVIDTQRRRLPGRGA